MADHMDHSAPARTGTVPAGVDQTRDIDTERDAFHAVWREFRTPLLAFIRARTGPGGDADDLLQETFLRAWMALSRGTVVRAMRPWLYEIARHLVCDWMSAQKVAAWSLSTGHQRLPHAGPTPEEAVHDSLSLEFLERGLEEALGTTADGRLRRLAFVYYYSDRLTVPQTREELEPPALCFGVTPPTLTQLNNWLSRGDILADFVAYLVERHPFRISSVTAQCLRDATLEEPESTLARGRWLEGRSFEDLASTFVLSVDEVVTTLAKVERRLSTLVAATLKAALHDARRTGARTKAPVPAPPSRKENPAKPGLRSSEET
jgi:DNA-directed RNA polymerase specialized sigma24 family protein